LQAWTREQLAKAFCKRGPGRGAVHVGAQREPSADAGELLSDCAYRLASARRDQESRYRRPLQNRLDDARLVAGLLQVHVQAGAPANHVKQLVEGQHLRAELILHPRESEVADSASTRR